MLRRRVEAAAIRRDMGKRDVWGEVSAGVNFFNFPQTTAVFAKLDVTLGDDLTGVGARPAWVS